MTDIEKAHYAAKVFSDKKYKGTVRWTVREITKTFYGEPNSLEPKPQGETEAQILVVGTPLQRYNADEAYVIATALLGGSAG